MFTEARVLGTGGGLIDVQVPIGGQIMTRAAARDLALELARTKPGSVVSVHRIIETLTVQEVSSTRLVRS